MIQGNQGWPRTPRMTSWWSTTGEDEGDPKELAYIQQRAGQSALIKYLTSQMDSTPLKTPNFTYNMS